MNTTIAIDNNRNVNVFQLSPRNAADILPHWNKDYSFPHQFTDEKIDKFDDLLSEKLLAVTKNKLTYLHNAKTLDSKQITAGWKNEFTNEYILTLGGASAQIKFGYESELSKRRWITIRSTPHIVDFLKSILMQ